MFSDLNHLILTVSYLGIFAIVFAETGLLVGFFLPGDSLLITAGLLAADGKVELAYVMLACAAGSIIGDQAGYWIGRTLGPKVFSRQNSRFFKPEYVDQANAFYQRHGSVTVLIARFIPIIRCMSATTAGVSRMRYPVFLGFSLISGLVWGLGLPYAGYRLGKLVPGLDNYILLVIAAIVFVSVLPIVLKALPVLLKRYGRPRDGKPG
ncbi:MAG TPA: DedA family protein, partial [Deinococcales bacterium]|nr:DedA family protein [Deinococcales bacterium]